MPEDAKTSIRVDHPEAPKIPDDQTAQLMSNLIDCKGQGALDANAFYQFQILELQKKLESSNKENGKLGAELSAAKSSKWWMKLLEVALAIGICISTALSKVFQDTPLGYVCLGLSAIFAIFLAILSFAK